MIENDRQYVITCIQRQKFGEAIKALSMGPETKSASAILAKVQLDALKSEYEVLTGQIEEYHGKFV